MKIVDGMVETVVMMMLAPSTVQNVSVLILVLPLLQQQLPLLQLPLLQQQLPLQQQQLLLQLQPPSTIRQAVYFLNGPMMNIVMMKTTTNGVTMMVELVASTKLLDGTPIVINVTVLVVILYHIMVMVTVMMVNLTLKTVPMMVETVVVTMLTPLI